MRHIKRENINNILFLDIETAPKWETLDEAPENVRNEWIYKFKYNEKAPLKPNEKHRDNPNFASLEKNYLKFFADLWKRQAGLYPEFSRVICVSAGFMYGGTFRLKSYFDDNEAELLKRLAIDINSFQSSNKYLKLCAHYGKGFDYPFLGKRYLIHRQEIPLILDTGNLKPWEVVNLDTQEIWKLGGYGSSATLSSIAMAFGIPTPKDDIDGADVARCYHEGQIDRIVTYCEKDVVTLLNVFKAMRGEAVINELQIEKVVL